MHLLLAILILVSLQLAGDPAKRVEAQLFQDGALRAFVLVSALLPCGVGFVQLVGAHLGKRRAKVGGLDEVLHKRVRQSTVGVLELALKVAHGDVLAQVHRLDLAAHEELVQGTNARVVVDEIFQGRKVFVLSKACIAAVDDEEATLAVLVRDRISKVRVAKEAGKRLDVGSLTEEGANSNILVGDLGTHLANVPLELLLVRLHDAHEEGGDHLGVVVAPHVALRLVGLEGCELADQALDQLPHHRLSASLRPDQAHHDARFDVRILERVGQQIEQKVVLVHVAAHEHLQVLEKGE